MKSTKPSLSMSPAMIEVATGSKSPCFARPTSAVISVNHGPLGIAGVRHVACGVHSMSGSGGGGCIGLISTEQPTSAIPRRAFFIGLRVVQGACEPENPGLWAGGWSIAVLEVLGCVLTSRTVVE